ncbi:MAG: hypothetical protein M5U07_12500 [Xanthobacteraceae bacterium]|nr:hypothetical protein [Xanthobacteraceae bacterium]
MIVKMSAALAGPASQSKAVDNNNARRINAPSTPQQDPTAGPVGYQGNDSPDECPASTALNIRRRLWQFGHSRESRLNRAWKIQRRRDPISTAGTASLARISQYLREIPQFYTVKR